MIDLSKYRVIDLSYTMVAGERKIDGRYLHGDCLFGRPTEVQEFIAYGARMHFIQGQTHSGTHAECAYKYAEAGPDFADTPVTAYMGEAVACNFTYKKGGETITIEDFKKFGVKAGDIVLAWCSEATLSNIPYITNEAIDWLIQLKIKALVLENMRYSPPGTPPGQGDSDCRCLLAGIQMIDAPLGLHQIKKPRVFFMALPIKMRRITACTVRAIALEEID
jgi:kynurenine formamidase